MATSAIAPASSAINSAASTLKLDDLLKVLLTELTNQDPLKPVDNKDFMAQIAQFASLDSSQQLNSNIQGLVSLQSVNQSVGLLGREVTAITDTGEVTGKVTAISLSGSVPTMTITPSGGASVVGVTLGQLKNILTL